MKNAKKIVMGGVAALALVTASVMGTMAYFTSQTNTVKNTFTVGNVEISLDETDTTELGVKDTDDRVEGNEYKLIPGHSYIKDPTIHITDKTTEKCYLFVEVDNDLLDAQASDKEAESINDSYKSIKTQMNELGWTETAEGSNIYYYGKDGKMAECDPATKKDYTVFNGFTIKSTIPGDKLAKYVTAKDKENNPTSNLITIKGYAVQAEGIATDAISTAMEALGLNK